MIKLASLKVRCISRPKLCVEEVLEFLKENELDWQRSASHESDEIVEVAGRVCYMSFGRGRQSKRTNPQYIKNLITQGHESVLEHINWTFIISGVSRAFSHQLVRHRVGFAYSQLSQQYHDESEASFVAPPALLADQDALNDWKSSIEKSLSLYKKLVTSMTEPPEKYGYMTKKEALREIRSISRSVLPNATETKMVITANARALRHFFTMRGAIDGDWEMRKVACALYKEVLKDAPSAFQDFEISLLKDGSEKLNRL